MSNGTKKSFAHTLYFRLLVGIIAGVAVGRFFPHFVASLKPLGDGFLRLIRMLVAPVVFFTVVTGVAKVGDLRRLGRVGLKSLFYRPVGGQFDDGRAHSILHGYHTAVEDDAMLREHAGVVWQ